MNVILIPGANPAAAKGIFDAIRKVLVKGQFVELTASSAEQLARSKSENKFVIIGKSAGGRVALEDQLEHADAAALVLLAPAVEADERFGKIKAPTLVVHGTVDDVIPLQNSVELTKIISTSKLVRIKDADHSYRGKEAVTAKKIADWLKTVFA